jgi:hypothetical protein
MVAMILSNASTTLGQKKGFQGRIVWYDTATTPLKDEDRRIDDGVVIVRYRERWNDE